MLCRRRAKRGRARQFRRAQGRRAQELATSDVVLGVHKSGEETPRPPPPPPPPPQSSSWLAGALRPRRSSTTFHMDSWERWRGSVSRKPHAQVL